MKLFFRNNGLSLVLATLFFCFWGAKAVSGWKVHNEEEALHQKPMVRLVQYLSTGHFWQATGENWESEFLQMGAYVILTCFLFQKGSAESKNPDEEESPEEKAKAKRYSLLYRNSLSLAFAALLILSFAIHAAGGLMEENEKRAEHGLQPESLSDFLGGAEFWFQSFQNWQSEFLAVLSIVVLTIFLRQDGSPESKAVGDLNSKTGE